MSSSVSMSDFSRSSTVESTVDQVEEALPDFESFQWRTEPDSYGASYLIAQALRKSRVPRSFASWKHGWPHAEIVHPVQLAEHGGPKRTHLVPCRRHVDLLREFGYLDAHAVGLPFIYAHSRPVDQIPESLLVMPPHTLPFTDESWDEEGYVDMIADLKSSFSTIIACVHRHNVQKGQWTEALEQRGIDWVPGTRVDDKYGLVRMHTLFSMFEYMTTNTVGSHIPYAAYCGCKVSIFGPFSTRRKEDFRDDPSWSKHPDVLDVALESSSEEAVRKKFPFLFVDPKQADCHVDWARKELGEDFRRPPKEIAQLLGWELEDQIRGYANYFMTTDAYLHYAKRLRRVLGGIWSQVRDSIRSFL